VIREDAEGGTVVDLDNPLLIEKTKDSVCGFTVFKSGPAPIPFQVVLNDARTGEAQIILVRDQRLNYELYSKYDFEISADDCATGTHSSIRDRVHIEVEDVNDFSPVWAQQTYTIEAVEGILYKRLLKLEALDRDGTEAFSKICQYILLTPNVPFKIDELGYLQNTEPLDYAVRHNFILEIVAEDCGHKTSDKLIVNIVIKEECQIGWQGIRKTIDYELSSGRQTLTDNATLELCGASCDLKDITLNLKVMAEHKEKDTVCPLDAMSLVARSNFCGM